MDFLSFSFYFTWVTLCMMRVSAADGDPVIPKSCQTIIGEIFSEDCISFLVQDLRSNDALTTRCCSLAKQANYGLCYCDKSLYENAEKLGLPPAKSKSALVLFCQVPVEDIYAPGHAKCGSLAPGAAQGPGSTPKSPSGSNGKKESGGPPAVLWLSLGVGAAVAFIVALFVICLIYRRSRGLRQRDADNDMLVDALRKFSYAELESATNGFHELNKLGRGGFGVVYKGELPNGYEVAVKRLKSTSVQGDTEFVNEVRIISKVRHCNIVGLHGYCNDGNERMLVYPLMPRGSLNAVLFDRKNSTLSWPQRFRVIVGMARGLAYLHDYSTLSVVHCDVKPSNILLHDGADGDIEPCVADFGMARLMITQPDTISLVGGTRGYRAPEYANKGWLTKKVDVYSYGVVVLEILAGKPHFSKVDVEGGELSLLELVQFNPTFDHILIRSIIDVRVAHQISDKEATRMLLLSRMCTSVDADDRPSMSQVLHMLEDWKEPASLVSDRSLSAGGGPTAGENTARNSERSTSSSVRESSEGALLPHTTIKQQLDLMSGGKDMWKKASHTPMDSDMPSEHIVNVIPSPDTKFESVNSENSQVAYTTDDTTR